jgi:hypothetical protein
MRSFALLVLLACNLNAMQANEGGASVSGIVLQAATRAPIVGAEVKVGYGSTPFYTDSEGRFTATGLSADIYSLQCSKDGYGVLSYSKAGAIRVSKGETVEGLVLLMQPEAVISGRVVDADGNAVEAGVELKTGSGYWVGSTRSDSKDGKFVFSKLESGSYMLFARQTGGANRMESYAFFPGGLSRTAADVIELMSGDRKDGIEIRIPVAKFARIRGRFAGSCPENLKCFITPRKPDGHVVAGARGFNLEKDGSFELRSTEGQLGLQVTGLPKDNRQPVVLGQHEIHVVGESMEDIIIPSSPPKTLKIRLKWDESGLPVDPQGSVVLNPMDGKGIMQTSVVQNGELVVGNLSPDRYMVLSRVKGASVYLKRVLSNGVDVTATGIDLIRGDGQEVEVRFGRDGSILRGLVRDSFGKPIVGGHVVLFALEGGKASATYMTHTTAANKVGEFEITGIAPGKYRARVTMGGMPAVTQEVSIRAASEEKLIFVLRP